MHLNLKSQVTIFTFVVLAILSVELLLGWLWPRPLVALISGFVGSLLSAFPTIRLELEKQSKARLQKLDVPGEFEGLRAELLGELERRLAVWRPTDLLLRYAAIGLLAGAFFVGLVDHILKM